MRLAHSYFVIGNGCKALLMEDYDEINIMGMEVLCGLTISNYILLNKLIIKADTDKRHGFLWNGSSHHTTLLTKKLT